MVLFFSAGIHYCSQESLSALFSLPTPLLGIRTNRHTGEVALRLGWAANNGPGGGGLLALGQGWPLVLIVRLGEEYTEVYRRRVYLRFSKTKWFVWKERKSKRSAQNFHSVTRDEL